MMKLIKSIQLGEFEKAYNEYTKTADSYRSRDYGVEADMMEKHAEEVKKKIEK